MISDYVNFAPFKKGKMRENDGFIGCLLNLCRRCNTSEEEHKERLRVRIAA